MANFALALDQVPLSMGFFPLALLATANNSYLALAHSAKRIAQLKANAKARSKSKNPSANSKTARSAEQACP